MVSPTGQFITPATCPGFMLVDFITTHLTEAKVKSEKYSSTKHIEKELIEKCKEHFKLQKLSKDDSVTAEKMIASLERLLNEPNNNFNDIHLHITNYYSILNDGTVCIPWDFEVD